MACHKAATGETTSKSVVAVFWQTFEWKSGESKKLPVFSNAAMSNMAVNSDGFCISFAGDQI